MYNEELKTKFTRSYTQSPSMAKLCATIFNKVGQYEEKWGADVCTRTAEELQPMIDSIVGFRSRSKWSTLIILKDYVKWCLGTSVPNACDGMLKINTVGLDNVRTQMVSIPKHLQKYLDEIYDPESDQSTDNIYRCFFWLAYSGMKEEEILEVKCDEVDLTTLTVSHNGNDYEIHREAIPAFRNCVELSSFVFNHPLYSANHTVWKPRADGDTLVRGIRSVSSLKAMRMTLSRKAKEAIDDGKTTQRLSYYRVYLSGLFYRMYEREKSGEPVDFSDDALKFMEGREYQFEKGCKNEAIKRREIAKDYLEDYQRWKLAFFL